jgi:hypothetical protein
MRENKTDNVRKKSKSERLRECGRNKTNESKGDQ